MKIGGAVGGGQGNNAGGVYATISGGGNNNASGTSAAIGGGEANLAAGTRAVVPGGWQNSAGGNYSLAAGHQAQAAHDGAFVWNGSDGTAPAFASTGSRQFLVNAVGGVGINTNNPAGFALNVNGNVRCTALTQTSDARFKTGVATLDRALEVVGKLRGVSYEWDCAARAERDFPAGRQIGFIAQEVEAVLPELVTTDANGEKSVAYTNIVPVLVEAVKTQREQIQALASENAELRARIARIEARLGQGN